MSRRRMIEPAFWMDEKVGALSPRARLTYIALWTLAEDSGVGREIGRASCRERV